LGNSYPARFGTKEQNPTMTDRTAHFLGFGWEDLYRLALPGIYNAYVDSGPIQVTGDEGTWTYFCSRNNAFSNREQKGQIVVHPSTGALTLAPSPTVGAYVATNAHLRMNDDGLSTAMLITLTEYAKNSDGEYIYQLTPNNRLSIAGNGYIELWVDHPYKGWPLVYGRIFWTDDLQNKPLIEIPTTQYFTYSYARITQGGFYQVKYVVDLTITGVCALGVLLCCVTSIFLWKRYRCRCFIHEDTRKSSMEEGTDMAKGKYVPVSNAAVEGKEEQPASPSRKLETNS